MLLDLHVRCLETLQIPMKQLTSCEFSENLLNVSVLTLENVLSFSTSDRCNLLHFRNRINLCDKSIEFPNRFYEKWAIFNEFSTAKKKKTFIPSGSGNLLVPTKKKAGAEKHSQVPDRPVLNKRSCTKIFQLPFLRFHIVEHWRVSAFFSVMKLQCLVMCWWNRRNKAISIFEG